MAKVHNPTPYDLFVAAIGRIVPALSDDPITDDEAKRLEDNPVVQVIADDVDEVAKAVAAETPAVEAEAVKVETAAKPSPAPAAPAAPAPKAVAK